ncbi:MAG TPA: prolyl oligopeptidase family serine peptidase, partial [Sphingomonas sp.]
LLDIGQQALRYLGPTLGQSSDPIFSPDGRQVAFIQFRDPPADLPDSSASFWSVRVVDVASGAVRTIWSAPDGEGSQFAGTRGRNLFWTASGHLLFPWERTGWMHIYALSAAPQSTPRDLTPDANEVEAFTPTPDGKAIVYAANAGNLDTRQLWRAGIAGGKPVRLTQDDAFVFRPVFAGDRLAATATEAQRPAHMVLVDGMKPLGSVAVAASYATPETIVFTAADGVRVHGQLFRGKGPGPHPALIFVHGGPRRQMLPAFNPMHYYSNAYVRNQQFAALGYTVLSVNYRSGTNYGRAFREAPETGRGGASEYRDVLAGAQWLAKQPDVDPKRLGIWGGSWGGYLTALALARDSELFAAGADFHGVHTLVRPGDASLSPGTDLKARELQWQSSPIGSIDRWRSPVLIVHGDDDKNVDHDQSLLLARELTARGVPFEELSLPNERHEFFRYDDWLASYRATEAFFARTLKDQK